jgi:hypothetical protein
MKDVCVPAACNIGVLELHWPNTNLRFQDACYEISVHGLVFSSHINSLLTILKCLRTKNASTMKLTNSTHVL